MRKSIRIQDYKNGWFAKHLRCAQGADIYGWVIEHVESNPQKANVLCQKMIERDIIQNVDNKKVFNINDLYRLYMDREDIADNLVRKWKSEVRGALEVSVNLIPKIEDVYNQAIVEEDE
jgi:hypothetical protein